MCDVTGGGKLGEKILKFWRDWPGRKSPRNRFKPGNEQGRSKGCLGLFGGASGGFTGWSYHPAWWFGMILPDHARFGRLSLGFLLALLVVVLVSVQAGTNDHQAEALADRFWRPGVPVSVAVRDGQAKFRVPASGAGSEVLVIVSALAYLPGPYSIRLDAAPATDAGLPDQAASSSSPSPPLAIAEAAFLHSRTNQGTCCRITRLEAGLLSDGSRR